MPNLPFEVVNIAKALLACGGLALLAWHYVLTVRNRATVARRTRDVLLALLGAASVLGWFNFGQFHHSVFLHYHEFFHYYLGSKYFPELGYTRLYQCVAAVDLEDGVGKDIRKQWVRDLQTNVAEPGSQLLADSAHCSEHFAPGRWSQFQQDVRWLRSRFTREGWLESIQDHGFNATPVWTATGRWLSNLAPASKVSVYALGVIDPALILVMWAMVWWAFGWRTMCVAMLWWGTNYAARWAWTGGAFMRADWLLLLVSAICLAKRGAPTWAGAALGYSTLLRVFPGFAAAGPLAGALAESWPDVRALVRRERIRLACGVVLALVAAAPLTAALGSGMEPWKAFAANSRKHLSTPLTNNVGLKSVLSVAERNRAVHVRAMWLDSPWDTWRTARHRTFEARKPVFWVLVVASFALLALAARGQPQWVALTLGVGFVPVTSDLACYYYSMLLVFALLWREHPLVPVALLAVSVVSNVVPVLFSEPDDVFTVISAAIVVFAWFAWISVALSSRVSRSTAASPSVAQVAG